MKLVIGIIAGVIATVFIAVSIFMLFFYKKFKLQANLSSLPPEVRVFYDNYYKSSSSWTKEGL